MRFSLDIDYPVERMARSQARLAARAQYQPVDRVPVGFCLVPRFFAPLFGLPYGEFFRDAETQYYWQLQFLKYRLEHIPEDIACTGPTVWVSPYFDNVLDSDAFGAQVIWPENETLHAVPTIHSLDAMERFTLPALDAGLWGRSTDWWRQMQGFVRETRVTFNGVAGRVDVGMLGPSYLSPHMIAVDLVGTDFYLWQAEHPAACHRFLAKLTQGLLASGRRFREIDPRPRGWYGLAEDSAQVLSPAMFREFCVPYADQLFTAFGAGLADGRSVHMCGQSSHLHGVLVNDLRASSFNLFGYLVPPAVAARNLGGRMLLWGNLNPMLLLNGTPAEVKQACRECLTALAPCGGFLLGDGANVCPGTPLANLAAVTAAAEEYAAASPTPAATARED
jgi:hypothetical protein